MVRPPYHIARQEHLGDALDDLAARGVLRWRWEYDSAHSRAIYHVVLGDREVRVLGTADAEKVVQRAYEEEHVPWLPVPHPGGERQRTETLRRMRELSATPRGGGIAAGPSGD